MDEQDICGDTQIGATGIEWICISPPHGPRVIQVHNNITEKVPGHYYVNRHALQSENA